MNKNTFMYPVRMTAVLAAAVLVTSCAKDKFTEANALDLELKRLRTEDSIRVARERQQRIWENNRLFYQRVLDSLDRINAGGRVFYTVTAVAAGNAAFGSGRVEEMEGVQNATVSIAQYGNIETRTTPASGMVTVELRSGSASVVVSHPNHTTVNYTVNLTADGNSVTNNNLPLAPGNGHTIHVGNVIPLFPIAGAGTATVRGRAYIETDLTNETAELVTPAVLGAGTNLFTANIDINPIFRERYLKITNSATAIANASGDGFEGEINRISYENATTSVVVDANGNYSGVIPASASGLPIQLRYSQIAADRRFWASSFDGRTLGGTDALGRALGQVITRRFIYGPFPSGNDDPVSGAGPLPAASGSNASISFSTELAPAQVTAAFTRSGRLLTKRVGGIEYFVLNPKATSALDSIAPAPAPPPTTNNPYRRGLYLADVAVETDPIVTPATILPPEVVFSPPGGTGTTATGIVELEGELGFGRDPVDLSINFPNSGRKFRRIKGIRVVNAGSGYTSDPTITFIRRDGTAGTGANAGKAFVTGKGTLQAPTSEVGQIQVIDGGFGFLPLNTSFPNSCASREGGLEGSTTDGTPLTSFSPAIPLAHYGELASTISASSTTKWTGMTPRLPNAPFSIPGTTAPTLAETNAIFHFNAIGAIDRITLTNPIGANITQAMIDNFNNNNNGLLVYGEDFTFPSSENDNNDTERLFVRHDPNNLNTAVPNYTGPLGAVVFNLAGGMGRQFGNDAGSASNTAIQIANFTAIGAVNQPGNTIPYVFLPNIALENVPSDVNPRPTLSLEVGTVNNAGNQGKVTKINLTPGSAPATPGYTYDSNAGSSIGIPGMTMRITPVTNNTLRIRLFPKGSGIDNYFFDSSQQEGRFVTGLISDFFTHPFLPPTTGNLLGGKERDTYIVEFDSPKDPLGTPATGRPVFNNNRQLIGIDIINPGAGYSSSSPPNFRVIPNPKEGITPNDHVDDDAKASAHLEPERLVFTIQNGGRYAACPDVFLSGGGVTLAQQPQNAPGISSIYYVPVLPSGFSTINNGDFELTFDATTGAIKSIKYNGSGPLPKYTSDPITVTISPARQNDALNRAWASIPASLPSTDVVVGDRVLTRSISTDATTGAITGIELIDRPVTKLGPPLDFGSPTPIRFWEVGPTSYANLPVPPNDDWFHFFFQQYIIPPAVNIASPTGTGAQAVALLENNILPEAGKLRGISIAAGAGGTGYRVTAPIIPRNGNILATYSGSSTSGFFRNFGITAPGDGASGSDLLEFDAFSGVTYIRDVHYGTGRYFGTGQ